MRILSAFLLLWACLGSTRGQAATNVLKAVQLSGQPYVSLANWAEVKGFKLVWLSKEELQLTNRWAKLAFKVGSRKIELNGVVVWLSFPIEGNNSAAWVSRIDLNTLIHPVLYPQVPKIRTLIRTVVLDPGHGGKDPGYMNGRQQEKHHALLLAIELRKLLQNAGIKVLLTRTNDTYIKLPDRPGFAQRSKADLFISLHYNSVPPGTTGVKGSEVYCMTPAGATSSHSNGEGMERKASPGNLFDTQNILLAYQVQKAVLKGLDAEDRGVLHARDAVLRTATMPAILIEGGFMSDPEESRQIYSQKHRQQLAMAIVDGVLAYKRLMERPPTRPNVVPKVSNPKPVKLVNASRSGRVAQ